MIPADERLERANAVLLEVEQRLIVEFEFPMLQREAKVSLQLTAVLGAAV
jgi:hypothetical protein